MKLKMNGWSLLGLVLFMPLVMTQSICQEGVLHGSVRSQSGEPLAGVTVRSDCGETKTNEQGRYWIQPPRNPCRARIVQFRAEGFCTLTKAVQENTGEINGMLRSGVSAWIPPTWDPADSMRVGGKMKFLIPKSAKIKYGPPSDAWHIGIGYGSRSKREWMGINGGGNYSSGLPYVVILYPNPMEIIERDMACGPNGYDIRGRTKDGKRWRHTGMGLRGFGESVGYSNASDKAAEFFDSIIDGLQCDQEGAPGFGRIPKKRK